MKKWLKKGIGILFTSMLFFGGLSACTSEQNPPTSTPNEELSAQEEIYKLALKSGYEGTYEEWLQTIRGEKVALSLVEGVLCWKYESEADWKILLNMNALAGDDGREVVFNVSLSHIQWKYENEDTYKDLISLESLKGQDGENGVNGLSAYEIAVELGFEGDEVAWLASLQGAKGEDGREVEFNVSLTHIQWRYVGEEEYKDLVALEDLKGKDGQNGTNGTNGVNGLSAYEIAVELGFEGDEVAWLASLQGAKGEDGREVEFNVSLTHIQWRYVGEEEYKDLVALEDLKGKDGQNGTNGTNGVNGLSAYEIAVKLGFEGDEVAWLASLQGAKGEDGREVEFNVSLTHIQWRYVGEEEYKDLVALEDLKGKDGQNGTNGVNGLSAYEIAVELGFEGDEVAWLASLQGAKGEDGREVEFNVSLTHIQWRYVGEEEYKDLVALEDLKGKDGQNGTNGTNGVNGLSAYEIAVKLGFEGDEVAWLASLQGAKGEDGREVEFNVSLTHIQWRYVGEEEYKDLIPLSSLQGNAGLSAYEIYLKYHPEYQGSEEDWINDLVSGKLGKDNDGDIEDDLDVYEGDDYLFTFVGDYAILARYIGDETKIVVPTKVRHNGKVYEVYKIDRYAFLGEFDEITIPSEISNIEENAFSCSCKRFIIEEGITYLNYGTVPYLYEGSIYLPKSLRVVNSSIWANDLYYAGSIEDWINIIFMDNPLNNVNTNFYMLDAYNRWELVTDITIPGTVKELEGYVFGRYRNFINITIEYGVEFIKAQAFIGGADTVKLPSSIKNIEPNAFVREINNLYFDGTIEELESVNGYENATSRANNVYVLDEFGEWTSINLGKTIRLELSGPADYEELNLQLIEDFKKTMAAAGDPNTYEITYVYHGEAEVDYEVVNWVEGPDVYAFASDKMGELYKKGALSKLGGNNLSFVENNMTEFSVNFATFMDGVYAYPMTADNTYYTQYDASQLSETDVASIEALLDAAQAKGKKVAYNLPEAYWGGAAMFTFGADYNFVYDEYGNVLKIEADFDSVKGVKAAKAIYKILSHPAWTKYTDDPDAIACIDGTWFINSYKEKWADNYACAVMPTVTVDGDTKNLGAFVGGKLLGVNPQRSANDQDRLLAAHKLAQYLVSAEAQLKRYDAKGNIPCNLAALEREDLATDPNVLVLSAQQAFAHAQTKVPETFWSAPYELVAAMREYAFGATAEEFQRLCDTMNSMIAYNDSGDDSTLEDKGTFENPFTIDEAIAYMQSEKYEEYKEIHVKGVATSVEYKEQYASYYIYLGDNFQIYSGKLSEGVEVPEIGDTVIASGLTLIYTNSSSGKVVYEIAYNASHGMSPVIYSVEKKVVEDEIITAPLEMGTYVLYDSYTSDGSPVVETYADLIADSTIVLNIDNTFILKMCHIPENATIFPMEYYGTYETIGSNIMTKITKIIDQNGNITECEPTDFYTFVITEEGLHVTVGGYSGSNDEMIWVTGIYTFKD